VATVDRALVEAVIAPATVAAIAEDVPVAIAVVTVAIVGIVADALMGRRKSISTSS
jgi:hypothetical protein